MLDSLVLAAALHLSTPDQKTPPPAPLHTAAADRAWSVQRPSRGAHASAVRSASRVPDRWRSFAQCVLSRESGASLDRPQSGAGARNPSSSAAGRWQFLDTLWRDSLAGQVAARLRDHGLPKPRAAETRRWLERHHIASWPGVLQDVGFVEVLERGGSYHWRLAGSKCEAYR